MSEARLIIIDGYNVIQRAPELRPGPERTLRQSREKLLSLLAWAVGSQDSRFLVVFDGDEGGNRDDNSGRVEIRFSRLPEKADDLIRRIVEDQIDRVERLTVVTSDIEVAQHARRAGADISIADLFLASVLGPVRESDPSEKPSTLTRKELEEWQQVFSRHRDKPEAGDEGGALDDTPGETPKDETHH